MKREREREKQHRSLKLEALKKTNDTFVRNVHCEERKDTFNLEVTIINTLDETIGGIFAYFA